jgi:hypothetical protein
MEPDMISQVSFARLAAIAASVAIVVPIAALFLAQAAQIVA